MTEADPYQSAFLYLLPEKHINLDRDRAPCTKYEDRGKSFTECLAERVMQQSNCKVINPY